MPTVRDHRRTTREERILRALTGAGRVVVVTHDNPDPDAVAAAWGMVFLVERALKLPAVSVAGGTILRAENRLMVDLLQPPLSLIEEVDLADGAEVVVVDTQYPARLESLAGGPPLAAVIDHHAHEPTAGDKGSGENGAKARAKLRFRFRDVRPRVLATSSMVAGYLKALGFEPERALATALLYGIHTDARGWDAKFSRTDRAAIAWLSQFSDPELLAQIERARIPRAYFEDLLLALQSAFIYGDAAVCFLPSSGSVEVVGEVADLLLRCEGVERVLCAAVHGDRLVVSARTSERGGSAAYLLRRTLRRDGSCGGHTHRAAGYVALGAGSGSQQELESKLRGRWLEACGVEQTRGSRLVAKKEILKALE
jgi:nanoRNase/pAp phosphatase (c-di-AMP/oligoRNAs hydrolase)